MIDLSLVVATAGDERDLLVRVATDTTIGQLLEAAEVTHDGPHAWVDGHRVDVDLSVAAAPLAQGCTLSTEPCPGLVSHTGSGRRCRPRGPDTWQVTIVAGTGTGRHVALDVDPRRLGRADDNDLVLGSPTVSAHHLSAWATPTGIRVEDLGSHNGTWVGDRALVAHTPETLSPPTTARLGAAVARFHPARSCDAPRGHDLSGPSRTVHRPPRAPVPPPVAPVTVPTPPEARASTPALRWAGILAPIGLGAAMVVMTGSLRFALFALLSPVMAVANWWSGRRRARRDGQAASRDHAAALRRFHDEVAAACARERERRDAALPDLGEIVHRATEPSRRLWERRPHDDDAFLLRWGSADVDWLPPLVGGADTTPGAARAPTATDANHDDANHDDGDPVAAPTLHDLPVPLDMGADQVVGIVGDPVVRRGVARCLLLQAVVLHGPADLTVDVTGRGPDWDWAKWLPHLRGPVGSAADADGPARHLLVVDPTTNGRTVPTSSALRSGPGSADGPGDLAIVLADHPDQLPASCTVVVEVRPDGTGRFLRPAGEAPDDVVLGIAGHATARRVARALARCRDADSPAAGRALPHRVALQDVVATNACVADHATAGRLTTPIGVDREGTVELDLVADGPHALVAGTTGSGKSELLRSLVTGLALRYTPDQVVFVLVDYKGGSAFRACADLPHTVGLVTDLDDHLGARALRSLRAELRHREQVLADAGVDGLDDHRTAGSPGGPLPRLVVVVDEFATLADELPDFLDALVGIAQRGRSLGLHLVLATQRPRGCVSADIRANTNLRVALRVQGEAEARDVIDDPRPARIGRDQPGRAWIRRGHAELAQVQVALASASPADAADGPRVHPFRLDGPTVVPDDHADHDHLARLVAVRIDQVQAAGVPAPRRPWLPMLATRIPLDTLRDGHDDAIVLGLADLPDDQDQRPAIWSPSSGHLAVHGRRGSGTTTALATIASGLVLGHHPDDVHLHLVDGDSSSWKAFGALPHVGSIVDGHADDDVEALLDWVRAEIATRRAAPEGRATAPRLVLLVDGLTTVVDGDDPRRSTTLVTKLGSLLDDGPVVGVTVVAATERAGGLPARLRSAFSRHLVLDVEDRDLAILGLDRRQLPRPLPGRATDVTDGTVLQIAEPPDVDQLVARCRDQPSPDRRPHRIVGLPDHVTVDDLPAPSAETGLWVPVGMARDTAASVLHLHDGDHAIVAGPPRSGRTTTMQAMSCQVRAAAPDTRQVAICDESRSALHGWPSLDASGTPTGMQAILDAIPQDGHRWVVLVDDLGRWGDLAVLGDLARSAWVTLVVAGRPDDLRGTFGGWLRTVRAARTGVLLQPDLAVDGDLLGTRLPRRLSTPLGPGRGFVVSAGIPAITQFARPPADPPPGGLSRP